MAWVSPRVYAILSQSEEGKDIIEKLPDLTQDECQAELDAFFGEGGKGASSSNEYGQAKMDDEAEENAYKAQGDEEVSDEDFSGETQNGSKVKLGDEVSWHGKKGVVKNIKKDEDGFLLKVDFDGEEKYISDFDLDNEVTDEEISEALADFEWQITDSTTVGDYAQETADKLGCSKEQVLKVIRQEDPNISEDEKMAKVAGLEDEEEQPKDEDNQEKPAEPIKLDDLIGFASTRKDDKDYDAYSFKKELERNGYKVDYIENRSGTWQNGEGNEKYKEYDIKLEDGQHIYFKLIADENYDTKEVIAYKNGKNW